jgi:transposase InsO family protein
VPTSEGWLYLAVVLDLFTRKIVGWAMRDHMRAELTIAALTMAIQRQKPPPGGAAVDLGMPLLIPEPFDLGNCHAFDANPHQRGPHFLELEWLDDGDDTSHGIIARCSFGESGASGIILRVETSPKCKLGAVANLLRELKERERFLRA